MINKIGIENFRVFKDYTELEIAPITVLTGPNNSGKSSLIKLLNLVKNSFNQESGLNRLKFEGGNHNLGTFENILSRNSSKDHLAIVFDFPLTGFDQKFKIELIYSKNFDSNSEDADLISIKVFNDKLVLFRIGTNHNTNEQFTLGDLGMGIDDFYSIDLAYLKKHVWKCDDLVYNYFITTDNKRKNVNKIYFDFFVAFEDIFSSIIHGFDAPSHTADGNWNYVTNWIGIMPTHSSYQLNWSFADVFLSDDQEKITVWNRLIQKYLENKMLNEDSLAEGQLSEIQEFLENIKNITISLKPEYDSIFYKEVIENVEKGFNKLIYTILSFDQISASRGNHKRYLLNNSENEIDEIVRKFKISQGNDHPFLKESLSILGISDQLEIERKEGMTSYVYLKSKEIKVLLSDLGFGYSQILPIILKIIITATSKEEEWYEKNPYDSADLPKRKPKIEKLKEVKKYEKTHTDEDKLNPFEKLETMGLSRFHERNLLDKLTKNTTLIIEEPEANLHPNFQSKLADILVLAQKQFNIKFILETHSEYLIRKLQYLTAKNEIERGDVNIYYYNDDKYVNEKEPKVKLIQINEFGALTDSFGPGFFDEATNLQFELLKINKGQNN